MNVLINMAPLKKGGGQNVGLNFVTCLYESSEIKTDEMEFFFAVAKGSDLNTYLSTRSENVIEVPSSPLKRFYFEKKRGHEIIEKNKIDIIYSIFGIGYYPRRTPQISGVALSNLFFPEIDFWSEYSGITKLKKWLVDQVRIQGLKRATALVFENEEMENRCHSLYGLKDTRLILPSISTSIECEEYSIPIKSNAPKGLFLCGWQRNKNFMIIPELAATLKRKGVDFHFIVTAEKDASEDCQLFISKMEKLNVGEMISIVGRVKKEELKSLYNQIDFVFLLSKLESFSNNIIEAWTFSKSLIISDASWSIGICSDAAMYVDRSDVNSITNAILLLINSPERKSELINNGIAMLEKYPTIIERTNLELEYIREVYEESN